MSNTPETDTPETDFMENAPTLLEPIVLADFARKLERERNKWKLCADKLYTYICKHNFGIDNSQCEEDMCPLDLYEHIDEWFEQINRETK